MKMLALVLTILALTGCADRRAPAEPDPQVTAAFAGWDTVVVEVRSRQRLEGAELMAPDGRV